MYQWSIYKSCKVAATGIIFGAVFGFIIGYGFGIVFGYGFEFYYYIINKLVDFIGTWDSDDQGCSNWNSLWSFRGKWGEIEIFIWKCNGY